MENVHSLSVLGWVWYAGLVSDDDSCIKAIREMAVLKEDGWHRVYPIISKYLGETAEGTTTLHGLDLLLYDPLERAVYYVFPEVIFTHDVVQSVLKFIRKELPVLKQER